MSALYFLAEVGEGALCRSAGCGVLLGGAIDLDVGDATDAARGVVLDRCQLHLQRNQIHTDATQQLKRDPAAVAIGTQPPQRLRPMTRLPAAPPSCSYPGAQTPSAASCNQPASR